MKESALFPYRRPYTLERKAAVPSSGIPAALKKNFRFDAVVIDDTQLSARTDFSVEQRLERALYLTERHNMAAKFVQGRCVWDKREEL